MIDRPFTGRNLSISQLESMRQVVRSLIPVAGDGQPFDRGPSGTFTGRRIRPGFGRGVPPFDGELWVYGYHLYDDVNFSPENTEGTSIGGTFQGAVWIEIDLSGSTPSANYQVEGPTGAHWGDNKVWRRISECGGPGKYILC